MNLYGNIYYIIPKQVMILRRFKNGYLKLIIKAKINLKDIR